MLKLPEIPKLPEKEELEYRKKEFLFSLYEEFRGSSKLLLLAFAALLVLSLPLKFGFEFLLVKSLVGAYRPPLVNRALYTPQDLEVLKVETLPLDDQSFSAIAQVLNPNAEISVYFLAYEFILKNEVGQEVGRIAGESFISARESKFILEPLITAPLPAHVELRLADIRWTKKKPEELKLEILQKNVGQTLEGNFFAEGQVRNLQGYGFKKVLVQGIVFDAANQNILAVNQTVLTEVGPFESRYFRMVWPRSYTAIGQVYLVPSINFLDPGLILEKGEPAPVR